MLMNKKSYPVTVQKTISVPDEASAVEQKNSTAFANDCSQLFLSLCFSINNVAMCVTERSVWNFISDKEKQAELPTCKSKKCELLLSTVPKPKKLKSVEKENILQAAKAEVIDC